MTPPAPPARKAESVYETFAALDIRIGRVRSCQPLAKARRAAYQFEIDFGEPYGVLCSAAQVTENYSPHSLVGRQVVAVVNFPKKRIAGFESQCLILGASDQKGHVVLLQPERELLEGSPIF